MTSFLCCRAAGPLEQTFLFEIYFLGFLHPKQVEAFNSAGGNSNEIARHHSVHSVRLVYHVQLTKVSLCKSAG
jgi:hypothetical protein